MSMAGAGSADEAGGHGESGGSRKRGLPWKLAYQTVLPDDYREDINISHTLSALARAGLWGLEVNVSDPDLFSYADVAAFLGEHGLAFSMFATGLSAKTAGYSLSSLDETERKRAVAACARYLRWVEDEDVGAIIGFMKGMDKSEPERARAAFRESVMELAPEAEAAKTPLIIEATNRYETLIANTLSDALSLVEGTDPRWVKVLPDTFHMNIEEADMGSALESAIPRLMNIHLSENNRTLPGRGGFEFPSFLRMLDELGYAGRLAMEGNLVGDEAEDVPRAAGFVYECWEESNG